MSRDFGFARVSCGIYQSDGIVPFRTLNLSEHDARDGWDRFMTYKISPVLANTSTRGIPYSCAAGGFRGSRAMRRRRQGR